MKSIRTMLPVVLLSLSAMAFAQSDAQKPVAQSDAQRSFDKMKTLAGSWEGHVTTVPQEPSIEGKLKKLIARAHELQAAQVPQK